MADKVLCALITFLMGPVMTRNTAPTFPHGKDELNVSLHMRHSSSWENVGAIFDES